MTKVLTCIRCIDRKEHGYRTGDKAHCKDCHADWGGMEAQHCVGCHLTFTNINEADAHKDENWKCTELDPTKWHEKRPGVWTRTVTVPDFSSFRKD